MKSAARTDNLVAQCYSLKCGFISLATDLKIQFLLERTQRGVICIGNHRQHIDWSTDSVIPYLYIQCPDIHLMPAWKLILYQINKFCHTNIIQSSALTTNSTGVRKNQHILHHIQKKQLFFPIIISMSSINLFPPVEKQLNGALQSWYVSCKCVYLKIIEERSPVL